MHVRKLVQGSGLALNLLQSVPSPKAKPIKLWLEEGNKDGNKK